MNGRLMDCWMDRWVISWKKWIDLSKVDRLGRWVAKRVAGWMDQCFISLFHLQNRATGNIPSLRLRAWLQRHLFNLGCIVQAKCGTVLFLGMLFLSLSCIGLKTVTLETNLEKLWVEGKSCLIFAVV